MSGQADSVDVVGPAGKFRISRSDLELYRTNHYYPVGEQPPADNPTSPGSVPEGVIPGLGGAVPMRRQVAAMDPWGLPKAVAQGAATIGTSAMLGPEAGLIQKMIAAYLASTGAHMAVKGASGGEIGPGDLGAGVPDALAMGVGGAMEGGIAGQGERGLARSYRVPNSAAAEARDIASQQATRLAGRPTSIPAHMADPAQQLRDMGIVPGPPVQSGLFRNVAPETGSLTMERVAAAPMDERNLLLQAFDNSGVRATRQTFSGSPYVTEAREAIRRSTNGDAGVKTFNKMLDDYIAGGTEQSFGNPKGNVPMGKGNPMRRMGPAEWESDKELWAKSSKYGSDPETQAIKARLNRALTDAMRDHIESLTPALDAQGRPIPGGVGRIESLNRQYQTTLPQTDVIRNAELNPPPPPGFSLRDWTGGMPYNEAGRAGLALSSPSGIPRTGARVTPEALLTIGRLMALYGAHPHR